jgi:hypothetical protein
MTMITLTQNEQPVSGGFRVDVSRGERVGRVSSEWFSRPDDERYLSLTDLHDAVRRRAERAQTRPPGDPASRSLNFRQTSIAICSHTPKCSREKPASRSLTLRNLGRRFMATDHAFGKARRMNQTSGEG